MHKSNILVDERGGSKDKKVFVIGALENKPKTTTGRDGMDTLSMVVLIVGSTYFGVAVPFGS